MNGRRFGISIAIILGLSVVPTAWSADPFPPSALPGISIGGKLPAGYETSGIVWHPRLKKFFVISDSGTVTSMLADGTSMVHLKVGGDLEGITVARPQSNFVYLGIEHPDSIRELNIVTGKVTRTFDLTAWMKGADNSGLEALTFVPDVSNKEGGLFYAGLQADGSILVFQLPIASSKTSTAVKHVRTIPPLKGVSDISDMHYEASQSVLYAIYDGANLLRAMKPDGTLIQEWKLPGKDQEGITLKDGDLYIGEDYHNGGDVIKYPKFLGAL
ncbi:MAG: esterase-like activity of phytase family protein [Planctomycetia bacterium]|nr:esterase-like activity of phytase family protein [Planctomycetia bacterium]